jgi:hypothetical protein
MARLSLLLALAAALAVPVAVAASSTDVTMSVKRGRALIVFNKLQGTALGRLASGKVRIHVLRPRMDQAPQFQHCRKHMINKTTTVCQGKKLSFRALDGHYVIRIQGTGIFMSAAGQGTGYTQGAAIPGLSNGVMSFDDGPNQQIPDVPTPFTVGTPGSRP